MAIRRYVAIRRDMWRCHALCVPYVSSTSLPEDCVCTAFARCRSSSALAVASEVHRLSLSDERVSPIIVSNYIVTQTLTQPPRT